MLGIRRKYCLFSLNGLLEPIFEIYIDKNIFQYKFFRENKNLHSVRGLEGAEIRVGNHSDYRDNPVVGKVSIRQEQGHLTKTSVCILFRNLKFLKFKLK